MDQDPKPHQPQKSSAGEPAAGQGPEPVKKMPVFHGDEPADDFGGVSRRSLPGWAWLLILVALGIFMWILLHQMEAVTQA
ncbi:MAG: hypothetical protein H6840_11830 [Planctomycetes bacterium]|nr:hypothetical protein [Planctomycetota bacterium]